MLCVREALCVCVYIYICVYVWACVGGVCGCVYTNCPCVYARVYVWYEDVCALYGVCTWIWCDVSCCVTLTRVVVLC